MGCSPWGCKHSDTAERLSACVRTQTRAHTCTHTSFTDKDVSVSCLVVSQLFATPWTVAHQAPLSVGFSRQEYWSGLPCLPPRDLPNPGREPRSPTLLILYHQQGSLVMILPHRQVE